MVELKRPGELPTFSKRLEFKSGKPSRELKQALIDLGVPGDLIDSLLALLGTKLLWGNIATPELAWYQVNFDAFPEPPTVLALSRYRGEARSFEEKWLVPEEFALYVEAEFHRVCVEGFGDWGLLNWVRDAICWLQGVIGYVAGLIFGVLFNLVLKFSPLAWYAVNSLPTMALGPAPIREIERDHAVILGHADSELFVFVIGKRSP